MSTKKKKASEGSVAGDKELLDRLRLLCVKARDNGSFLDPWHVGEMIGLDGVRNARRWPTVPISGLSCSACGQALGFDGADPFIVDGDAKTACHVRCVEEAPTRRPFHVG